MITPKEDIESMRALLVEFFPGVAFSEFEVRRLAQLCPKLPGILS